MNEIVVVVAPAPFHRGLRTGRESEGFEAEVSATVDVDANIVAEVTTYCPIVGVGNSDD